MNALHKILARLLFVITIPMSASCMAQSNDATAESNIHDALANAKAATHVETTTLAITSYDAMMESALQDSSTMVGYPIEQQPKTLNAEQKAEVERLLLQSEHYFHMQTRCANNKLAGLRFIKDEQITEVAVGSPCNQVIWAYKKADRIQVHVAMLPADTVNQIFSLVESLNEP